MNLDEYRAMVASEADTSDIASVKNTPAAQVEATPAVTPVVEQPTVTTPVTPAVTETPVTVPVVNEPIKYNIDGVGEFTADEIKEFKQSGLRQQDYTRKTQEVASARKENQQALELFNYLKANPHIAKNMLATEGATPVDQANLRVVNPDTTRVDQLATELSDMKLQREIDDMTRKYADFEVLEVLDTAMKKGFTNLDDAYKFVKGEKAVNPSTVATAPVVTPIATPAVTTPVTFDVEAERNRIRAELQKELANEKVATSTIITANPTPPVIAEDAPLSPEEDKVRQMFRMTVDEYKKYKS